MTEHIFTLLMLLQLKHWYIDFVDQCQEERCSKGVYCDSLGLYHSIKHGFGTMLCLVAVTGIEYLFFAVVLAMFDFVLHYHIDWAEMNYGSRDIDTKEFWHNYGLDQLAHQLTYVLIAYMVT